MNWKLFIIISLIFLSACSNRQTVEDIPDCLPIIQYRTFDCGTPPDADYVEFNTIEWVVIDGLWTLAADEYGDLGENTSTIIKAARQQKAITEFYEACINAAQEQDDAKIQE